MFCKCNNEKPDRTLKINQIVTSESSCLFSEAIKKNLNPVLFGITPSFQVHIQLREFTWFNFKNMKLNLWQTLPVKIIK